MIPVAGLLARRLLFPLVILGLAAASGLAEAIRLAQNPALSPDSSVLAFAWRAAFRPLHLPIIRRETLGLWACDC